MRCKLDGTGAGTLRWLGLLTMRRSANSARNAILGKHSAREPKETYFKYSNPETPVGPDR